MVELILNRRRELLCISSLNHAARGRRDEDAGWRLLDRHGQEETESGTEKL